MEDNLALWSAHTVIWDALPRNVALKNPDTSGKIIRKCPLNNSSV